MNNTEPKLSVPDRRSFRYALNNRPKPPSESNLQLRDSGQVWPAGPREHGSDGCPVDAGDPRDLSLAAVLESNLETQREPSGDLRNRVVTDLVRPRDTKLAWGSTRWARTHASTLSSLIGSFDSPMSVAHGLLIGGINSHLMEDARLTITDYNPRMEPSRWTLIAPFVRDVVSLAAPVTAYSSHRLMTVCAHYVDWCVSRAGYPLDARVLFRRETIENYTRRISTELSDGTLRNYRSMLLRISEVVLPEHKPVPMSPLNERSSIAPYSETEESLLRRWARGQNTAMKERKAMALLALCGGAGLKSIEVAELQRRHVVFDDLGILVHVTGAGERSIPLLAEWEPWLRVSVEGIEPGDVIFGMPDRSTYRNLISSFVSTTSGELRPRSDKLRATWLVKHLRGGTPMKALMKAAGIVKFENLARYLAYVPELDNADYRARLRMEAKR